MSAQPHEPAPAAYTRPEPTIRSVRAALPEEHRKAFQAEIERTPLPDLGRVLTEWDLGARALSDPHLVAAAQRVQAERAGILERPRLLTDDEVRALRSAPRP